MELGRRVGLFDVPASRVVDVAGRDGLLIERFDRTTIPGQRRIMITALTILGLHEQLGHYATYWELAHAPSSPSEPNATLRNLFANTCSTSASATSTTTLATTPGSGTASS
jgi:serine/threonine-protein kinase HipA